MTAEIDALYVRHLDVMQSRLAAALEHAGLDRLIVLAGEPPAPAWDDQPYPFRAYPPFLQWCPLPEARGSALLLEPGGRPRLILLQPDDYWHAPPALPAASWTAAFEIEIVTSADMRNTRLREASGRIGILGDDSGAIAMADSACVAATTVGRWLDYHRAEKTAYEIACIEAASAIAVAGHRAVAAPFAAGVAESAIDAAYMQASGQRLPELPYPNIVALNEHSAILHYQHLDRTPPPASNTLLIDAGARYNGYAADITRTHHAARSPLAELHGSMETLQQTLCREAVAGVEFIDLNARAHELLAGVLAAHGLVRCSAEVAYDRGITRVFLPHGLGHLLGLQVHDVAGRQREPFGPPAEPPPGHPFLRLTRRLAAGFVVTIEPGLYFIESLYRSLPAQERALIDAARFEAMLPYGGIRIEDDVAIEAGDNSNLTRTAFAAT